MIRAGAMQLTDTINQITIADRALMIGHNRDPQTSNRSLQTRSCHFRLDLNSAHTSTFAVCRLLTLWRNSQDQLLRPGLLSFVWRVWPLLTREISKAQVCVYRLKGQWLLYRELAFFLRLHFIAEWLQSRFISSPEKITDCSPVWFPRKL